jgi:hypothetical protein
VLPQASFVVREFFAIQVPMPHEGDKSFFAASILSQLFFGCCQHGSNQSKMEKVSRLFDEEISSMEAAETNHFLLFST